MKTLLRRLLGPSKRELQAKLRDAEALAERRRVKAEEGDTMLCREIDRLNDELDTLHHKFAPIKFENDRLKDSNEILRREDAQLRVEKERLRLDNRELHENIERLNDRLEEQADAYAKKNEEIRREWDKVVAPLQDQIRSLADQLAAANIEKTESEQEADGLNGYFENIDKTISEALEKVGAFPPKPAGAADRIDVICQAVVDLHAENKRLTRMLTEPEFLRAESQRVGGIITTSADLKHWAARVLVASFAASLDGDRAVELTFGTEEHGRFLVTIRQDDGRSLCDEIRTLEIALEASAELEQEWKKERRKLRKQLKYANKNLEFIRQNDEARRREWTERSRETEQVKNTCASLRYRCDGLAHALIGLTKAVADMRDWNSHPTRENLSVLTARLERAVREADRVLGSEPSAA